MTGRPHRDGDRLAADADLEWLLDGHEVALGASRREPERVDVDACEYGGACDWPLHVSSVLAGRAAALSRESRNAQLAFAQTANTVIDQFAAVAATSRTVARKTLSLSGNAC